MGLRTSSEVIKMMTRLVFLMVIVYHFVNAGHLPKFSKWLECQKGLHHYGVNIPGESYAYIKLDDITATDYNGNPAYIRCLDQTGKLCKYEFGKEYQFKIGETRFTMKAIDRFHHSQVCNVVVTVADNEPPKFSNNQCKLGVRYEKPTLPGKDYATVKFDVKVSDNNGPPAFITCSARFNGAELYRDCNYEFGKEYQFKIGTAEVHISAIDISGGASKCRFFVIIKDSEPPNFKYDGEVVNGFVYEQELEPGNDNAMVKIADIKISDNTGVTPHLALLTNYGGMVACLLPSADCDYEFDKKHEFKVGRTELAYRAIDESGLATDLFYQIDINMYCPPLVKTSKYVIEVNGNKTFTEKQNAGTMHVFECAVGFRINYAVYECRKNGLWYPSQPPICKDLEPPKFSKYRECTNGIFYSSKTLSGKSYATIRIGDIKISENSGIAPKVECLLVPKDESCNYEFGKEHNFDIGHTSFRIKATDQAGLYSYCRFEVNVKDEEPPKLLQCPSNIIKEVDTNFVRISWNEPSYSDNSGQKINIRTPFNSGSIFSVPRVTEVKYDARDQSNNVNTECKFTVTTKKKIVRCKSPIAPDNSAIVTGENLAVLFCRAGYNPNVNFPLAACKKGIWDVVPSPGSKISDIKCTAGIDAFGMAFNGDCNTKQGKQEIMKLVNNFYSFIKSPTILCGQKA